MENKEKLEKTRTNVTDPNVNKKTSSSWVTSEFLMEKVRKITSNNSKAWKFFWFPPVSIYFNIKVGILVGSLHNEIEDKEKWRTLIICTAFIPFIPISQILTSTRLSKLKNKLTYGDD